MSHHELTDEQLQELVSNCFCWNEVLNKLGMKIMTRSLQRRIKNAGIDYNKMNQYFEGLYTKFNRFTKEQIKTIVENGTDWKKVMKELGYNSCTHLSIIKQKLDKLEINYNHLPSNVVSSWSRYTLEEILVPDSLYADMRCLLRRLKKERNWEHKCSICNLTEWNGKPISLEIDHIDGCHSNNSYENLRTICPNCHAQTDTYKGKNMAVCKNNPAPPKPKPPPEPKPLPEKNHCIGCSKIIKNRNTQCNECRAKTLFEAGQYRKVERPSYEQLKKDILEMPIVQVGKKYGVSDNAIRKWLKKYEKYTA
jgi:hypothetical protein